MSHSKLDNYVVLETIGQGAFGVRQKISRISDEALFEWQEINYRSMDFEAKEVLDDFLVLKPTCHSYATIV